MINNGAIDSSCKLQIVRTRLFLLGVLMLHARKSQRKEILPTNS